MVGARANLGASSGTPWFDAGLTVCSITITFTSLALTPCKLAVQPQITISLNALPGKWPYTEIFPVLEELPSCILIQLFQTNTPLITYMQQTYIQGTCPCLTNRCLLTPSEHIGPLIFF